MNPRTFFDLMVTISMSFIIAGIVNALLNNNLFGWISLVMAIIFILIAISTWIIYKEHPDMKSK